MVYVGSIVWFEARLGYNQPQGNTLLVIVTFSDDNERHERVLRLEKIDGRVRGTTMRSIIRASK